MYSFLYTIAEKLRDVPYFSKNILSHLDYSRLHIMSLTLVLHCNCMPHIFCCLHICGLIWPGHATLCRCTGVGSCRRLLHTYTPIFKKNRQRRACNGCCLKNSARKVVLAESLMNTVLKCFTGRRGWSSHIFGTQRSAFICMSLAQIGVHT